ncbi:MAG: hypothetical protein R6X33_06650 [Candidatus Brocadiia bacterium]
MLDEHDERSRRCPRLGHEVSFHYCRTQEGDRLCPRILDCWWETFDVRAFLEEELGTEEVRRLEERERPDKRVSILQILQEAKRRVGESNAREQ